LRRRCPPHYGFLSPIAGAPLSAAPRNFLLPSREQDVAQRRAFVGSVDRQAKAIERRGLLVRELDRDVLEPDRRADELGDSAWRSQTQVRAPALRLKQHLPGILAVLNEVVRRRGFVELEDASDLRRDHSIFP